MKRQWPYILFPVIIGLVTGFLSSLLGFDYKTWQHWSIFGLGMGSFILGRILSFLEYDTALYDNSHTPESINKLKDNLEKEIDKLQTDLEKESIQPIKEPESPKVDLF